jgi:hypothetical protein
VAKLDGAVYPSALGSGTNIVLFDIDDATAFARRYVEITAITVSFSDLPGNGPFYPELPFAVSSASATFRLKL